MSKLDELLVTPNGGWCCGSYHIHGFYGSTDFLKQDLDVILKASADRNSDDFQDLVDHSFNQLCVEESWGNRDPKTQEGCVQLQIILTSSQQLRYESMIENVGFRPIDKWVNPNTDETLTLYSNTPMEG